MLKRKTTKRKGKTCSRRESWVTRFDTRGRRSARCRLSREGTREAKYQTERASLPFLLIGTSLGGRGPACVSAKLERVDVSNRRQ